MALIIFQRSLLKQVLIIKRLGYNINVLQQHACLVVNPIRVDFLFIVTPIVGVRNCSMFCCTFSLSILVLQSSWWGREIWLLAQFVFLVSRDGWAALPHSAMGLSAVCDCGISWSYSLTILETLLSYLLACWRVGLKTLWWFRLKYLSIDEMVGAWCFGCCQAHQGLIFGFIVFSFMYCWVLNHIRTKVETGTVKQVKALQ